jgi:hypothetical protein
VKDAVEEQIRTGSFAGASPPTDAPSPTADDTTIFAEGIENARTRLGRPGARDVVETYDMDMEDDPIITDQTAVANSYMPHAAVMYGAPPPTAPMTARDPRLVGARYMLCSSSV